MTVETLVSEDKELIESQISKVKETKKHMGNRKIEIEVNGGIATENARASY